MPKPPKYVPKHRHAPAATVARSAPVRAVRTTVVLGSLAATATGVAVAGGVLQAPTSVVGSVTADLSAAAPQARLQAKPLTAKQIAERADTVVSRSDRRTAVDPAKKATLTQADGPAVTGHEDIAQQDPRTIASALLADYGWSSDQFGCLDSLWTRESGWRVDAQNASSGAYGIPQSLPGSKMATVGSDWTTNPVTQIKWGLGYIQSSYGSPCGAWGHSQSYGWY